jgi:hypothetical protein
MYNTDKFNMPVDEQAMASAGRTKPTENASIRSAADRHLVNSYGHFSGAEPHQSS